MTTTELYSEIPKWYARAADIPLTALPCGEEVMEGHPLRLCQWCEPAWCGLAGADDGDVAPKPGEICSSCGWRNVGVPQCEKVDMSSEHYSEAAFYDAWCRGVTVAGGRWFGDGQAAWTAATKWDLVPRVDDIEASIGVLSSGEAVFLAAMTAFYNDTIGGRLLQVAVGSEVVGLADIAAALDEPRRRIIAALLVSYAGW